MNTANLIGYPLLVIAALELFLGLLILRRNPRNSVVNKATAACVFASACWSFSSGLMYIRFSLGLPYILFARLSWTGWFTVPTALQTVLYLRDEKSRLARLAGWTLYPFWTVVLLLCLSTDLIVTEGYLPLPYRNSPGPLELPLRFIGSLIAFWLIYEIIRLRSRTTGYRRTQLGYFLYGTIFFGMGGAIVGGILQVFTGNGIEPSLSAYFSLPWVVLIFYSITRYRLFDIRLILSRTLAILLLSFGVSALQFFLFRLLAPVVGDVSTIFISVPLIGVIFFGTPLSRKFQTWLNDLILGDRYLHQKMLRQSANAMISILDRDEILQFVVNSVRSGMGVRDVFLFLQGRDGTFSTRHCEPVNRQTPGGCVLPDLVIRTLEAIKSPLISEQTVTEAGEAGRELQETLRRLEADLVLPLRSKGRLLGVLTLGERMNGEPYLPSDIDALQMLANHAAVAVENAELFEDAVHARASKRESDAVFRTLAETTAAAIFIIRHDRIIYANRAASRLSGYDIEDLLTMSPWSVIHPDHRDAMIDREQAWMAGREPAPQFEFKFIARDGSVRWAITNSAVIELQGMRAILSTMVDITDLRRAEDERFRLNELSERRLRERVAEQERFRAVLDAAADGFWITDGYMGFEYVNAAYCEMTGYSVEELLAMRVSDLNADLSRDEIVRKHADAREQGHVSFETKHRCKDGRMIDVDVVVTPFAGGERFFTFVRDISERKRAEIEKARYNTEREKILKDLHDGIGGLTTNINLLAEIAQTREDPDEVRRSLATIAALSRESLSEIRTFLQSLDVKDLTWHAVASELRHLGNTIVESHAIRFSLNTSLPDDDGGPSSVVAMNLFRIYKESLANVVKHARASSVEARLSVYDAKLVLEVRDDGVGLEARGRAGRGLLNMRSRAAEMAGSITVESGQGTTVCLEVPIG